MSHDRIEQLPPLPRRPRDGYKGVFGKVGIVGGCAGLHRGEEFVGTMIGAPTLAAKGALRSGCGIVMIAAPSPIIDHVLTVASFATGFRLEVDEDRKIKPASAAPVLDEMMNLCDVVVAGMGMCPGSQTCQVVMRLLGQEEIPVVADASALTELSCTPDFTRDLRAPAVLTPHPGEAARLMKALAIAGEPAGDDEQRTDVCVRLAQRTGSVVALKGYRTVVSDGQRVWTCTRGHPALGVGGSGDVLAGAIGSVIAQTRKDDRFDLLTATAVAVEAHAIAGERWAEHAASSGGMMASELADTIMSVVEEMRESPPISGSTD